MIGSVKQRPEELPKTGKKLADFIPADPYAVTSGRALQEPVSLLEIAPTAAAVMGIPTNEDREGKSLLA